MKKIFIYILPVMLLASCAKNLGEYNIDQKNPVTVSAASLFSNALKSLTDNQTTPSVNINVFRFWTQQWAATTYQDEPRYNITTRNIPLNYWTPMYREVLMDLKESKTITEADATLTSAVKNNRVALTEITSVYTWSILVNTWGDIPYSEALSDVNRPVYDRAADIYADLFRRLDAAIALLTIGNSSFDSADLLYNGDNAAWIKFANSLKLKLAITVADVDPATAQAEILAAYSGAFTSNADNAVFAYQTATPNNNPISTNLNSLYTSRQDYVAGATIIDKMNALNDPRRSFYFTEAASGGYVGGNAGSNNLFADLSHVSDMIIAPDFEAILLDYSEVEFILAEAAERWGIAGSAAEHYTNAITASIEYWGGTAAQATIYLAQTGVAYATATGNYKQKIGEQKYLALYNRGYDSWIEYRRLDYPVLVPAAQAVSVFPLRLTYPTSERTLNQQNVESASVSIGGDGVGTKIFWDLF
ncbi:SusD/RagB family nutrient-binding outer membrane lipoprotein [Pedobacter sp. AW1-32]|uniref:SusD/RagB family nutrient-binding outer membrane lipoprotein n=1 Tax=Pedobacter sp. AW1-32 TaxID=3383026 RepID=UPI003FF0BBC4